MDKRRQKSPAIADSPGDAAQASRGLSKETKSLLQGRHAKKEENSICLEF